MVGTVLVLGITVLGIGVIMLWGAPTLQAIQDRNAVVAMEGELIDVRTNTLDLMIDKSSRLPEVVVETGTLGMESGTRYAVTSNHFQASDPGDVRGYFDCEMVVTGWDSGTTFSIDKSLCTGLATMPTACPAAAGATCLEVSSVTGSNFAAVTWSGANGGSTWDITIDSGDLGVGDWNLKLVDDADATVGDTWIIGTARIAWDLSSSSGQHGVYLEGGAIFERRNVQSFLIKSPPVQEDSSGLQDYVLRLPTYIGDDFVSVSGPTSAQIFVGQVGNNHLRISATASDSIRFAFAGSFAEEWCRAFLDRNNVVTDGTYVETSPGSCSATISSVEYSLDNGSTFAFELIHARITARIRL